MYRWIRVLSAILTKKLDVAVLNLEALNVLDVKYTFYTILVNSLLFWNAVATYNLNA